MLIVLTAVLSFILYAVAALRSGRLPGPGGLLLLAASVLWLLAIGSGIVFSSPVVAAALLGLDGIIQMSLGYLLLRDPVPQAAESQPA